MQVFTAFLVSCVLLMAMSWIVAFYPGLSLKTFDPQRGIFVKNYIDQSQEFALCAVALAYPIIMLLRARRISAGVVAWRDRAELRRQHGVRDCFADGDGHHADHAGGVRAAASEMASQRRHRMRRDGAGGAGLGGVAAVALDHRDLFPGLSIVQGAKHPDVDRPAAGVLAEVAAAICRSSGHRSRYGVDARTVRAGRRRAGRCSRRQSSAIRTTRP